MKAALVPIPTMCKLHDFQESIMSERGKIIQKYFDELSIELLTP